MKTKIPQTKNEAFAQLDAMLSEEEKRELVKSETERVIDYGNIKRVSM